MIHRYTLADLNRGVVPSVTLKLPSDFNVLDVQIQEHRQEVSLWVTETPSLSSVPVNFFILETSRREPANYDYLATVQHGTTVYHVFMESRVSNQPSYQVSSGNVVVPSVWAALPTPIQYDAVNQADLPPNGVAFYYEKKNGDVRLVRLSHVAFGVYNSRQQISGYDQERSAMRTFYLDSIVQFASIV